ncbi:unnamed protein product, partial [Gongylonema pulchrum]|uniref:N-acetylmuramoyl-L-alanine amidase n=1 Tax=Gongylonema pulchrum TaxID=637853 RepID=A0A183DD77_9BILA
MDLTDRRRQHIHNFLMWHRNNALGIDFDDTVPNTNTTTFGNTTAQQTANLKRANIAA